MVNVALVGLGAIGAGAHLPALLRARGVRLVALVDPDERRRELALRHPDAVLVSARTGEGLETLTDRIEHEFERTLQEVELLIPYDQAAQVALLHDLDGDLEREETAAGIRIRARLSPAAAARYDRFAANGRRLVAG